MGGSLDDAVAALPKVLSTRATDLCGSGHRNRRLGKYSVVIKHS